MAQNGHPAIKTVLVTQQARSPIIEGLSLIHIYFSAHDIEAGNKKVNLRQLVEARAKDDEVSGHSSSSIQEIRYREISTQDVELSELTLEVVSYETTSTHERFPVSYTHLEATLEPHATLKMEFPTPDPVEVVEGFIDLDAAGLEAFIAERGLAMDLADIQFCQQYFASEKRNPTITEIKMIDTYWSCLLYTSTLPRKVLQLVLRLQPWVCLLLGR